MPANAFSAKIKAIDPTNTAVAVVRDDTARTATLLIQRGARFLTVKFDSVGLAQLANGLGFTAPLAGRRK